MAYTGNTEFSEREETPDRPWLSGDTWLRGLFMVLFAIVWGVAEVVIAAVAIFQFGAVLFTRRPNRRLRSFGRDLADFLRHIIRYLTWNTDTRPWPFTRWPAAGD